MPETNPHPRALVRRLGPLAGLALPERHEVEGAIGVLLSVPAAPSIVSVEARHGQAQEMASRVAGRFGAMPPPRASLGENPRLLHTAPGTLVCVAEGRTEGELAGELRALLGESASVVDNSHGRTLIRLGGPRVPDLLAYGTGIDLSPDAFGPGACAATLLGHIAATLHLRTPAPELDILVSRAFAESLWHWLLGRARRFGYEVTE